MQKARWLTGFLALLLMVMGATAQEAQPITAENAVGLTEINRLGRGVLRDAVYSPAGLQLIVATTTGLWLHDANDMSAPPRHIPLTYVPTAIDIRPDGTLLAVGDDRGLIHLIDMQFGSESGVLLAHTSFITDVAYSPDGLRLASSACEPTIILWDIEDRAPAIRLSSASEIVSLAYSPDGTTLAAGGLDSLIQFWDALTGERGTTYAGHSAAVMKLVFAPDGQSFASAGFDTSVRIWDVRGGEERSVTTEHLDWITALAYSTDGRTLYSGSEDGTLRAWDTQIIDPRNSRFEVRNLAFGPASIVVRRDGRVLVVVSPGDALRVINADTGTNADIITNYTSQITNLAIGFDGNLLLSTETAGLLRRWDSGQETTQRSITGDGAYALGLNELSGRYITGDEAGRVRLWDLTDGASIGRFPGHEAPVRALAFAPDGATAASASVDGVLRLWDVASEELRIEINHEMTTVGALAFSPGSTSLVVGGRGGRVRLFDASTGSPIIELTGETRDIVSVRFSPDGALIAAVSSERTVVWAAATGAQVASFASEDGAAGALAFSPDSSLLAVGVKREDGVGVIQIIDLSSQATLVSLPAHNDIISALDFSGDGRTLAAASLDGTLSLWQVR
jgi:WD40 repeat protein